MPETAQNTPQDVLSQLMEAFRLHGSVSAQVSVRSPWGYSFPGSRDLGLLVVMRGRVLFDMPESESGAKGKPGVGGESGASGERVTLELLPGDVLAIPNGDPFTLRDSPDSPLVPIAESGACSGTRVSVPGAQTEFIVLRCELTGGCSNPVRRALPRVVHCPGSDGRVARWLEPTVRLLALESAAPQTGRSMVLNRLTEIVFIHLLRAWLDGQSPRCGGLLRAVTDPQLTGAFAAFHAEPGRSWTLETLADAAHMSRSSFAARFKTLTGETPLEYVTTWRVQQAKALLDEGHTPLKQIVASLGYASEAAFRAAFKKRVGETPGEYRMSRRNGEAEKAAS